MLILILILTLTLVSSGVVDPESLLEAFCAAEDHPLPHSLTPRPTPWPHSGPTPS